MAKNMPGKKPKNLKYTLGRLAFYFKKHLPLLLLIVLLIAVSALASVLGTYLLKPVVNDYILPGDIPGLIRILLFMGGMYLLGAAATYGYTQIMVKVAQQIIREIRSDLFSKVQSLPLSFFDARTHGEVMSRFTNDIDMLAEALNNGFTAVIQNSIVILGTFTVLIILSPALSLIVLACFAGMFLFLRFSTKKSHAYFSQQQQHMAEVNGFIEEMAEGLKVVKIFNHEKKNQEEFIRRNEKLRVAGTQALTYSGLLIPVVVSLTYFNYALSACIGAFFAIGGLVDLGTLASYLVYVRQAAMPVNQFSQQMNSIMAGLAGAEHIFQVMEEQPEVDNGHVTLVRVRQTESGAWEECVQRTGQWAWKQPLPEGGFQLIPLKGDVRFHDVVFSYVPGHPILDKINLYAKPGQKIAFVGSTGAGKTTITNLINRFYEIDSGTITYDGIDIRDIRKEDLRHSLSFVLQDTHLFTGTIADNIRYGRLDATMDEVIDAAKLANADSFIRRLPDGYDTVLTADGGNLSQGQRQLLNIARAAISAPPVLVLDEATSSVDTRTEKLIELGMDRLMQDRTVFVIAHRLSTVRNAKAIMVLEHGNIIERGSHDELIAQKGRYYQLYTGQTELD
ncbi:MAG: ABC transporter ATP-binding protein [Clostridiales bacterium]|nr:ABC transporter ATP-binding protein [Clostridiales bacterium]